MDTLYSSILSVVWFEAVGLFCTGGVTSVPSTLPHSGLRLSEISVVVLVIPVPVREVVRAFAVQRLTIQYVT